MVRLFQIKMYHIINGLHLSYHAVKEQSHMSSTPRLHKIYLTAPEIVFWECPLPTEGCSGKVSPSVSTPRFVLEELHFCDSLSSLQLPHLICTAGDL